MFKTENIQKNNNLITNIDQVINTNIADTCIPQELENNKEHWADEEGYLSSRGTGVAGFTYNPASGDSFQDQLQKFLRGDQQNDVPSSKLDNQTRAKYFQFCLQTFPAAKTTINADKDTLKRTASDLEAYIATKRSRQNNAPQPTDVTGTQTTTTTQQTVASGTAASTSPTVNATATPANAAFEFETQDSFFNEVDIKTENQPKEQNTSGNQTTTTKVDTKVDPAKKRNEEINQISKAVRTYYKVNSKKLSAKMNVCIEAYRSRLKLLKWYVKASGKDNGKNNAEVANNTPQNAQQTNNASMAAAFDTNQ